MDENTKMKGGFQEITKIPLIYTQSSYNINLHKTNKI